MAVRVPAPVSVARFPARPPRLVPIALTGAILLAACGAGGPTTGPASAGPSASAVPSAVTGSSSPSVPTASDAASGSGAPLPSDGQRASLLLEVRHVGGFINPAATIGAPSAVVVDTDGRIYTPRPSADGSGPLIPVIDVRDTGASGAAAILAAAHDAGLDAGATSGVPGDSGSTVFTLETPDGREIVSRVGALGPGGPGVPGAQGGASATPGSAAIDLLARLTDTAAPWPPSSGPAKSFEPTAYEVWVAPASAGGSGGAAADWPIATDPSEFGAPVAPDLGIAGLRSGEVSGEAALQLATALGSLKAGSDLTYKGHAYRVWVRPMLPDELGG